MLPVMPVGTMRLQRLAGMTCCWPPTNEAGTSCGRSSGWRQTAPACVEWTHASDQEPPWPQNFCPTATISTAQPWMTTRSAAAKVTEIKISILKNRIEIDLVLKFLNRPLLNWSLQSGTVPSTFKIAYITPLLKKADLDLADAKLHRPISNLSVISKLLELLVSKQLLRYIKDNDLFPYLQSAYRAHHSSETAVLKVLSEIMSALDTGYSDADTVRNVGGIWQHRP